MKAPSFWSHNGLSSTLLLPLAALYRLLSWVRAKMTTPYRSRLPVICIGNLTSGGTGKTPVSAYLAGALREAGRRPVILSRGYGGALAGPVMVLPTHTAEDCGDEPLLLREIVPVVIARNRADGAKFIEDTGDFDIILMDDGLQNPQLVKNISIAVFDGEIGVQNKRIFPAGPMRTPLKKGLGEVDLCLINGADKTGLKDACAHKSIIGFTLQAGEMVPSDATSKAVVAFAGIGRPARFFKTLDTAGYQLASTTAFGDHHPYSEAELERLAAQASAHDALLVTTQKDWVRLPKPWQKKIAYLPVSLHISSKDHDSLMQVIQQQG